MNFILYKQYALLLEVVQYVSVWNLIVFYFKLISISSKKIKFKLEYVLLYFLQFIHNSFDYLLFIQQNYTMLAIYLNIVLKA